MGANLHLGRMVFIVRDTLLVGLKQANAKASLLPSKRNKKVPQINAELQVDSLRLRAMGNRLNFAKAEVQVEAVRSKRNTKIWLPTGYVDFTGLRAYTPYFPVRMRMPGTRLRFDRNEIQLDSAVLHLGRSDLRLTGNVTNLAKSFFKKEELKAQLLVTSDRIDCNQLMRAMERGTAYMEKVKAGFRDTISTELDDMDEVPVVSDTTALEGSNCLFVVPPGIDFTFQTDIKKVLFGKLQMDRMHPAIGSGITFFGCQYEYHGSVSGDRYHQGLCRFCFADARHSDR